jgi:SAM-dependent methyltransferase
MDFKDLDPASPYDSPLCPGQDPLTMAYVGALNGGTPPPLTEPFSYLELGCGSGHTLEILAAAYPHGHFYGVDKNEDLIKKAQRRQEENHLSNLTFYGKDFGRVKDLKLPPCHYITLHNVWSYLDPSSLEEALHVIDEVLAPQGLLFINYHALPGGRVPQEMAHFLKSISLQMPGETLEKAQQALSYLLVLKENGAPFFNQFPQADQILTTWSQLSPKALVQQVLELEVTSFHFQEVQDKLHAYGLEFAGRLPFFLNFLAIAMPKLLCPLLRQIPDRSTLEIHKSFISPSPFHQELYQRSATPLSSLSPPLESFYFSSRCGLEGINLRPENQGISLDLSMPKYGPLLERLAQGSHSLKELEKDTPPNETLILLNSLIMGGQALPVLACVPPAPPLPSSFKITFPCKLNHLNLKTLFEGETPPGEESHITFASPLAGAGLSFPVAEAFLLFALAEGGSQGAPSWATTYLEDFPSRENASFLPLPFQVPQLLDAVTRIMLPKLLELKIIEMT